MENKYNNLLSLGDNVLAGYLFRKFQEISTDDIELAYKISAKLYNSKVPTYYMIEMLGILLDNAVEALKSYEEKRVFFEVADRDNVYIFSVRNTFRYVDYDEILKWFAYERSEKGVGRGLGLYQLKRICDEKSCVLECKNTEIDHMNWIEFIVKIPKADNM